MTKSVNPNSLIAGRAARDAGMDQAAARKERQIRQGALSFLDALLASPDGTATTDDATDRLDGAYEDGGRWRGSITRRLAGKRLIRRIGFITSKRASRHAGPVGVWQIQDAAAVERERDELRDWLVTHPDPTVSVGQLNFLEGQA